MTNTAVSIIPNSLCSYLSAVSLLVFSGESFHETLAWQRGCLWFCHPQKKKEKKKKTRERDVKCDGVSVARGWRALLLLGEQGLEKSLTMGRTSDKNTLDCQSFILLSCIFSMECILVGVLFSSLHIEVARLRLRADFVCVTGFFWLKLSLSIPVKFSPEATEPWIEVEWDFEVY